MVPAWTIILIEDKRWSFHFLILFFDIAFSHVFQNLGCHLHVALSMDISHIPDKCLRMHPYLNDTNVLQIVTLLGL